MSQALSVPTHVGLILDGNRRWAKANGLTPLQGHQAGYKTLKEFVDILFDKGVRYVTAYVFSTENWQRSEEEVGHLMDMALKALSWDLKNVHKKGIRVRWLGSRERLSAKHLAAIEKATSLTRNNERGDLCFCFNYGGQQEIVDAARTLIAQKVPAESLTIERFAEALYEPDIPPVDIMVRSSGERRISNFMLWRIAYSELLFMEKHWPDFNKDDAEAIVTEYGRRQRRFGS